ncbi:MAG: pyruvate-ferredoxin/flavodoxin oxidoreductase, partial [Rhodothermales bacterium]
FEYHGSPSAERVVVLMGSGCETVRETLDFLNAKGENLGFVQVRLYRPFAAAEFAASLPASCRHIAVLDRTKEPGAPGEPLYQDVLAAFADTDRLDIRAIRGRYGLSSKEFTPAMVKAIFDELSAETPRRSFTIGIHDDLGHSSLDWDASFSSEAPDVYRAVFLGLGSDGTVSANKSSIKIIAGATDHHCQAYFVYDSKKAGSQTISHLRFGPQPIRSTYLIREAHFVGCHQFQFIRDGHALRYTRSGGILLINSPWDAEKTWRQLPKPVQQQMIDQELRVYLVDAAAIAREVGLGRRINTVMQACFFALADVLPREDAIAQVKAFLHKAYGHKGEKLLVSNESAIELALERMLEMPLPKTADGLLMCPDTVADSAPEFVRDVLAKMIDGRGDELPVSALPADGTYPSGTAAWEKRELTDSVPVWDSDLCVQCGNCSFVCPHACIRSIFCDSESLRAAPPDFPSASLSGRGYPNQRYSLQVYVEECTGCQLCVEVCPVSDPREPGRKAINMQDKAPVLSQAQENLRFFETLPPVERRHVDFSAVRGVQYLPPTFAFCGACAGCGETPYLRLLSQLFGDRLLIANATGCSSIYGGNLPTTPWGTGPDGRGPAWSNSLFEDNAEFGLGMRLAADHQRAVALDLLSTLGGGQAALARSIREAPQRTEADIRSQRDRVQQLITHLQGINSADARALLAVVESLVRRSVWCVGGDGWAYDIGYGGLDHVLASGRDVNILVLDTEVYSNTGGQASKATPLGAVAKFASGGKQRAKKDLALQVMAYGDVYVARVAMGANATQTLQAFREAEAYPGPSLILAYSHCIAHGIAMEKGLHQQDLAVASGCWPLCRYNPQLAEDGKRPLLLDSPSPTVPVHDYVMNEMRYRQLQLSAPQESQRLISQAQDDATRRWRQYCELAGEAVE